MQRFGAFLLLAVLLEGLAIGQYITGPRGGCYTITRSGAKRYVDRSLCQQTPTGGLANSRAAEPSQRDQQKSLYVRLADGQGRCFELYKDWSWAMVDSVRCAVPTPSTSTASPEGAAPPAKADRPSESNLTQSSSEEGPVKATPREYMTGPRGGCYTITPSGRKQYVPRSYCR